MKKIHKRISNWILFIIFVVSLVGGIKNAYDGVFNIFTSLYIFLIPSLCFAGIGVVNLNRISIKTLSVIVIAILISVIGFSLQYAEIINDTEYSLLFSVAFVMLSLIETRKGGVAEKPFHTAKHI